MYMSCDEGFRRGFLGKLGLVKVKGLFRFGVKVRVRVHLNICKGNVTFSTARLTALVPQLCPQIINKFGPPLLLIVTYSPEPCKLENNKKQ